MRRTAAQTSVPTKPPRSERLEARISKAQKDLFVERTNLAGTGNLRPMRQGCGYQYAIVAIDAWILATAAIRHEAEAKPECIRVYFQPWMPGVGSNLNYDRRSPSTAT